MRVTYDSVSSELESKRLKSLLKDVYNQPNQKQTYLDVMDEVRKVLNRLTYDERTNLLNLRDISDQPYFELSDNGSIILDNIPERFLNNYGLPKIVLRPSEVFGGIYLREMMSEKEFVHDSVKQLNKYVVNLVNDYKKVFIRMGERI